MFAPLFVLPLSLHDFPEVFVPVGVRHAQLKKEGLVEYVGSKKTGGCRAVGVGSEQQFRLRLSPFGIAEAGVVTISIK